ncbi:helix-turn-helix domain-containing protein [Methyloversatilis discipulorum]|uniref:helix-turn-helix domain-containing protein n=1 Tax=Methyloversatilis discipulorum TaxID=1119528 RepID=UPI00036C4D69|nr:AraC family transcriptional regulator [Methyloversatilis discipulorum]
MHAADPNVDTRCYGAEPAGHAHDFHQVVLGGDGGTELEVDGHLHRVDAGAGLVIPAGTRRVQPLLGLAGERVSRPRHWLLATRFADDLAQRLHAASAADDARRFPVDRIDAWLRRHAGEAPSLQLMAARFGYGPRRFHDLFVDAFGEPPHRYLVRLRLDAALALLDDSTRSLGDIALDTGFADQSAFTRRFTQRFGLPPGHWRRAAGATMRR